MGDYDSMIVVPYKTLICIYPYGSKSRWALYEFGVVALSLTALNLLMQRNCLPLPAQHIKY